MNFTTEKLAGWKIYARTCVERSESCIVNGFELENLIALAERALEPRGQALPVAWQVWWGLMEKKPVWPPFATEDEAKQRAAQIKSNTEIRPLYASQLALPAGPVSEGFVLVPMHLNAEMRDVLSEEDWTWEDLLVAANAVTEEQYYAIQSGDGESPAVAQPVADERQLTELEAHKFAKFIRKHFSDCDLLDDYAIAKNYPELLQLLMPPAPASANQPAEEGDKT